MVSQFKFTGFDACLTFGELILLNKWSEKPQPAKSKVLSTCFESWIHSAGVHELAQGKGKNQKEEEQEEGRPPSSIAANSQFKAAHHTFSIVVPKTWKGAPSIPSDFGGGGGGFTHEKVEECDVKWDLSLLFSPIKCPFPFPQCFLFLRKADPPGPCP